MVGISPSLWVVFILSALAAAHHADAQVLDGTTTHKYAIDYLKSQGKILPNVPNDFRVFGANSASLNKFYYHQYP